MREELNFVLSHEKCTWWQSFVDWRKINDKEMKPVMRWNSLNTVFRVERFKTRDNWVKTSNGSQIKTNKSANGKCLFQCAWRVWCECQLPLFCRLPFHYSFLDYPPFCLHFFTVYFFFSFVCILFFSFYFVFDFFSLDFFPSIYLFILDYFVCLWMFLKNFLLIYTVYSIFHFANLFLFFPVYICL